MRARRGDTGRKLVVAATAAVVSFAAAESAYRALRDRGCRNAGDDAFELYVVGESTAAGEPYAPAITPAGLVASRFDGRIGGRPIRPIVLAEAGYSIYPQSVALERALRCRDERNPGAVLIYSGHNDAGDASATPLLQTLLERVLSRSALLGDLIYSAEKNGYIRRERTFDAWRHNVRRVVDMSRRSGLVPILATAASNLAGIDPRLPDDDPPLAQTRLLLARGEELESKRRYDEALAYYAEQSALHPRLATYLKYRTGKCLEASGRYALARRAYQEVVDAEDAGSFGRAASRQNDFLRRLAAEESVPLADAVEIFARRSPHGIVGDGLFSDGQHPNLEGYLLLSDAYAQRLAETFHEPLRRSIAGPADALRAFHVSREDQGRAFVQSGAWFFAVAAQHGNPETRLAKALDRFQRAVALAPDEFAAWLGLGLTQAAMKTNLLSIPAGTDWLGSRGLFYFRGPASDIPENRLAEIVAVLRRSEVPEGVIKNILRAYRAEIARPRPLAANGKLR